jgi:hypothetical protein
MPETVCRVGAVAALIRLRFWVARLDGSGRVFGGTLRMEQRL